MVPTVDLPSAIPAFLEACGKLAGEAAARGDASGVRVLVAKAGQVSALRDDVTVEAVRGLLVAGDATRDGADQQ